MEIFLLVIISLLTLMTWKLHRIDKALHTEEKKHKNEVFWGYGKKK